MDVSHIAAVRAFNRFYTRQLGLLNEHIAASGFSLAEGRVLYEVSQRGFTTGRELAARLKVDPAYISRILMKLTGEGLAASSPGIGDRRRMTVALTRDGDAAVEELHELNNRAVAAVLGTVAQDELPALVAAMQTIRRILGNEQPSAPVILRPHRLGELGWLIHRQALLYNEQFGWNIEFEALIARIYSQYQATPERPPKSLWVAEQDGTILGSIFVMPSDGIPGSAQLRMLYVEPAARGQGIGATLVRQSVEFARSSGYERMRLWTHTNQESARRLYAAAGFAIVETIPERNFGKELTGEIWEILF